MHRAVIARYAAVLALTGLAWLPGEAEGQRRGRRTGIGVGAGLSAVGSRSGGAERAIHLQIAASTSLGSQTTAALVFDAYAMSETVAEPLCAPSATGCESRTVHPGAVLGLSLEARTYPWEHGLSLAAGVGAYWGPNVKGSDVSRSSAAVTAGADYELGASWWLPAIGFRFTHLTSDIAGVRWMASPSLGLRF
ncbi:MAG TPA: hypothetical protein VLE53_19240 [Gemmatimonadaceae bacterium]|nr:hypothetical protein [Gemmatimonadaceae bacterium]